MAHELTREEYLTINPPSPLPPALESRLTWQQVYSVLGPESPYSEIRAFYIHEGRMEVRQIPSANGWNVIRIEYHYRGREFNAVFQYEVTPDYFVAKIREDVIAMMRYPNNYASISGGYVNRTSEINESWGPSPIETAVNVSFQMSPEDIERIRQAFYENYSTFANTPVELSIVDPRYTTEEADRKSEQWLMEHLDDTQRAEYKSGYITVKSQFGHSYRVYTNKRQMNIQLLKDDGSLLKQLCVVSKDSSIPICDQVLMQKLMIETKEDEFLALAGTSMYRLERAGREAQLRLQYQEEMQAALQHYADAMHALDQEMQQTTNQAMHFNEHFSEFRDRLGFRAEGIS